MRIEINDGDMFGYLMAVREIKSSGHNRVIECRCKCGTVKNVRLSGLVSGHTKSCGCLVRKRRAKVKGGNRFGKYIVIDEVKSIKGRRMVKCRCDCGKERVVNLQSLRRGLSKGCGCHDRRVVRITHGMTYTSEYKSWCGIKERCLNPNNGAYLGYGGRGIKVCDRWLKFENFYEDMGNIPGSGYSIDRIDNEGDYCPENCRWATRKEQNRNKRNNRIIEIGNVSKSLADWVDQYGVNYNTAKTRLCRGWLPEKVFCGEKS